MSIAATGIASALPQAGAATGAAAPTSGLASLLSMRVKLLDPNELIAAAQAQAAQGAALAQLAGAAAGTTGSAAGQALLQEQQNRELMAQYGLDSEMSATTGRSLSSIPFTNTTPSTASRTGSTNSTTVPVAASRPATQITSAGVNGWNYWTAHFAQFSGKYNTDGPSMAPNCGPASVTMALRLIGLDVPGANGSRSNAVLTKARMIATGKNDLSIGTTDTELERVIGAAGGRWSETTDFNTVLSWARQGTPVILAGNPINAWNKRFSNDQIYQFDGGHWVTVSGYDAASNRYIVNDPLSQIGPIYVDAAELARYYNGGSGGLGIAVFK